MSLTQEDLNVDDVDPLTCLLELACKSRIVLLAVISELYEQIHGVTPVHMANWDHPQLLGWFRDHYEYNDDTRQWVCRLQYEKVH